MENKIINHNISIHSSYSLFPKEKTQRKPRIKETVHKGQNDKNFQKQDDKHDKQN